MVCAKCKKTKRLEDFPYNRKNKSGRHSYCKPCYNQYMKEAAERLYGGHKNFLLNLRYGISEKDVERLMEKQKGLCAICEVQPAQHVDHCHKTKKVRGLLCFNCNGALGRFEDDVKVLERAMQYLVAHGSK